MHTTTKILFHPIFIIFSTFSLLFPFYRFERNEARIAHTYSPTILKEKDTFIRKLLLWAFSGKNAQFRIYYYARRLAKSALILAFGTLLLAFIFKWYLNPSFILNYYNVLIVWMILVEGFPAVLISIHNHIVKKEKKNAKKLNNSKK